MTPFGTIEATPHRGTLMGNRGDLHAPDGTIGRPWLLTRWISCTLHSPTGHRVTFDTPGRYTPLFFADEVTALAAGHRPCGQCRRPEYDSFHDAWQDAFGTRLHAYEMDEVLHRARLDGAGRQRTFQARLSETPFLSSLSLARHASPCSGQTAHLGPGLTPGMVNRSHRPVTTTR